MLYASIIRPALFRLYPDPEVAHDRIMKSLASCEKQRWKKKLLSLATGNACKGMEKVVAGLTFPNPVGLAGGFDKSCSALHAFEAMGFGFIEGGTVTQHPQPGNEKPRVFRFADDHALINRFGFNNPGADAVAARLAAARPLERALLGISIGKSKITPVEAAATDYLYSLEKLARFAAYIAVNVSSPNTPGLRKLQDKTALASLLGVLVKRNRELAGTERTPPPLFLKIAPDLEPEALGELLEVCEDSGISGLIATNTTLSRDGLNHRTSEEGGLSGRPLFPRALAMVRWIRKQNNHLPIIGVGGIDSPSDAQQMIDAGADLVQIYTSLIYRGPAFPKTLCRALAESGRSTHTGSAKR